MSDLRDMDDWGFVAATVQAADGIGRQSPWPYAMVRTTLLWAGGVVPQMSHDMADLVERSIDRGEA